MQATAKEIKQAIADKIKVIVPSGANLSAANLSGANLGGANLGGADLRYAIGNGKELCALQTPRYQVVYSSDAIAIGCQQHSCNEWAAFDDDAIRGMDGDDAVEWWCVYKPLIFALIAAL